MSQELMISGNIQYLPVSQFVSYTKPCLKMDAISKTRTAVDMSVRLRIGRLQGTLLYKFISEIKVCLVLLNMICS